MALDEQEIERLPATLRRSPRHAQEVYIHTLEAAEAAHGDGEAAHRIAFASLKHSFEKVGDHWEPKAERGPSDEQDARRGPAAHDHPLPTAGGVNANATKPHLSDVARRLGIRGRSRMTKTQLVEAIDRANRAESARSLHGEQAAGS